MLTSANVALQLVVLNGNSSIRIELYVDILRRSTPPRAEWCVNGSCSKPELLLEWRRERQSRRTILEKSVPLDICLSDSNAIAWFVHFHKVWAMLDLSPVEPEA